MTPDQFRQALSSLGLSQVGAAPYLGVDARTIRRWAKDTPIPQTAVMLLRLYLWNPDLMDMAGDGASSRPTGQLRDELND